MMMTVEERKGEGEEEAIMLMVATEEGEGSK